MAGSMDQTIQAALRSSPIAEPSPLLQGGSPLWDASAHRHFTVKFQLRCNLAFATAGKQQEPAALLQSTHGWLGTLHVFLHRGTARACRPRLCHSTSTAPRGCYARKNADHTPMMLQCLVQHGMLQLDRSRNVCTAHAHTQAHMPYCPRAPVCLPQHRQRAAWSPPAATVLNMRVSQAAFWASPQQRPKSECTARMSQSRLTVNVHS